MLVNLSHFKGFFLIFGMDAVVEFFMVVQGNCSKKLWYCGMEQREKCMIQRILYLLIEGEKIKLKETGLCHIILKNGLDKQLCKSIM